MEKEKIKKEISELCSKMFGLTKEEVKLHNRSIDKVEKIHDNMVKKNVEMAEEIYNDLLSSSDQKEAYYAAVKLLSMKKNTLKARKILKKISRENLNPSLGMAAEIALGEF